MTKMNKNEQKMNQFLCYFGKILEWQMKLIQFSKNEIHTSVDYVFNEATIGVIYLPWAYESPGQLKSAQIFLVDYPETIYTGMLQDSCEKYLPQI